MLPGTWTWLEEASKENSGPPQDGDLGPSSLEGPPRGYFGADHRHCVAERRMMLPHDRHQTFYLPLAQHRMEGLRSSVKGADGMSWDSRDLGFRAEDLHLALPLPSRCHRALRTQKTGFLPSGPGHPVASMSPCLLLCSFLEPRVCVGVSVCASCPLIHFSKS